MDFIATYWWVWLIGLVAVLAVVAVRFVINLIGLAQDATELARKANIRRRIGLPQRPHAHQMGIHQTAHFVDFGR